MKKALAVLIIMLLIVALFSLAGCSKDKTSETSTADQPKVSEKANNNDTKDLQKLFESANGIEGVSYDMNTTLNGPQGTMSTVGKCFMSKKKFRMEMDVQGMKSIILYNGSGDTYMYNPATNSAMKSAAPKEKAANQWANTAEDLAKFKIVGHEKMDGYDCVVVTTTTPDGNSKIWLRKDIGMPVRMESGQGQDKMVIEYKNIKLGAQDAALFELPAGAQVIDMSKMQGGQMPPMPQGANIPKMPQGAQ